MGGNLKECRVETLMKLTNTPTPHSQNTKHFYVLL